jgi:hypothetical protein
MLQLGKVGLVGVAVRRGLPGQIEHVPDKHRAYGKNGVVPIKPFERPSMVISPADGVSGCRCGGLRYELTQAPYMIYTCHCTDCQHFTTSAFSLAMLVDAQAFHLTGVEPRAMLHTGDSGRQLTRWVCPECGSWICNGAKPGSANPNAFRAVRGTLDDTSWLRPTAHFWIRSKQPWVVLPDQPSHVFETQPDDMFAFFNSVVARACGTTA